MELFGLQTEKLIDKKKKSSKQIKTCHLDFPEENLSTPTGGKKKKPTVLQKGKFSAEY